MKHSRGTFCPPPQDGDKAAPPTEPKLSRISHATTQHTHTHALSHAHTRRLRFESRSFASEILFFAHTSHARYEQPRLEKPGNQSVFTLCTSSILVTATPLCPSQHNAVESRQRIDKAGGNENKPARKANMLPSASAEGGGRSYPAAGDQGRLKKPALRLESFHSSSSLMRRWRNASEGRRPCYVATPFFFFFYPRTCKCPLAPLRGVCLAPIPFSQHIRCYWMMEMSSERVAIAGAGPAVV